MPYPYPFTDPNIVVKDYFYSPITENIKLWWKTTSGIHTNYSPSQYTKTIFDSAAGANIQNYTGFNVLSSTDKPIINLYATTPISNLYKPDAYDYSDFRSRLGTTTATSILLSRKDGSWAALNGSSKAIAYAAASTSPFGAYSIFNLNAPGKRGYGWGSHGDPNAKSFKGDFTLQSNVVTKWSSKDNKWVPKRRNKAIPFRGDKINVIDYSQRSLKNIYQWRYTTEQKKAVLGGINTNLTQDFIKFYITGPKLHNGAGDATDDVMVFRATITTLDDSFSPDWGQVKMIGRADSNYHYGGYSRDMSLGFTIYATDRDELKPIYRKLNALAGYTAPTYDKESIGLIGPWMRITIGDLLIQQPVILDSLQLQLTDADTTWEINIEDDPEMKQVPKKISVTMQLKVITDYLPQKNGHFYSLSDGNEYGPFSGTKNWLTDSTNTTQMSVEEQKPNFKETIKNLLPKKLPANKSTSISSVKTSIKQALEVIPKNYKTNVYY